MVFLLVNKDLIRTSKIAYVYKNESRVNSIVMLISPYNNSHDMASLIPNVEICVPNGVGHDITCKEYKYDTQSYRDGYLSVTIPIDAWMTATVGRINLRIIFTEKENKEKVVFKSTMSTFEVIDTTANTIINYIPADGGGSGGDSEHVVYTVEQEDTTDTATASADITAHNGDVLVIKDEYGVSSGYQYYDGDWCAFTGNVSDNNVIMSDKFILAGNYVNVGNVSKGSSSATATLDVKGKTLREVMTKIFTQELQPTKSEPSANISFPQAGAKEVGTTVSPTYSASLNPGSYTYDSTTGVTVESWYVEDSDGHSSTTQTGSFDSFVVTDSTNYKITTTVTHTAGNIAKTNLGNNSDPVVKILSGTKTKTSSSVTGYRKIFYGVLNDINALTSDVIRGMSDGGAVGNKTLTVKVNGNTNAKRIIVAIPKASGKKITKVMKTDGLSTDITATYSLTEIVSVDGCNNVSNYVDYNIWTYQPASIDSAEVHEISIG